MIHMYVPYGARQFLGLYASMSPYAMLTHALPDVGRTCWWLDAEDGGGAGGRADLLHTYAMHMSPKLY